MGTHLLTPPEHGFVDPRRNLAASVSEPNSHNSSGDALFTANATGTTTTIVGADATLSTGVNVIDVGTKFVLKNAAGTRKEETVFKVTSVASSAGTTTVTFTPAAATAPVSTDYAQSTGLGTLRDNDSLDTRLNAINSTTYSQTNLDRMTQNDKVYALRMLDDPNSF